MNWIRNVVRALAGGETRISDQPGAQLSAVEDAHHSPEALAAPGIPQSAPEEVVLGMAERQQPDMDPQRERAILQRIYASYQRMKSAQPSAPAAYQPGHKWAPEIQERRADYLEALKTGDLVALAALLRNFYRNGGSYSLVKYVPYPELIQPSDHQLQDLSDFRNKISSDLAAWREYADDPDIRQLVIPSVGNPYGCVIEGRLITPAVCSHNYYFQRVNALLGDVPDPIVAEIGAGFGGIAFFLLNSGRRLHYIDFDLPEVLIMAEYYLLTALPQGRFLLFGEGPDNNLSTELLKQYDAVLLPNFLIPMLSDGSVDVVVNTHSLSEMEYPTVEEYLAQIARVCRKYFFHENSEWPVDIGGGNLEVTASRFPIPLGTFRRIYKLNAIWGEPRYREYLYERLGGA